MSFAIFCSLSDTKKATHKSIEKSYNKNMIDIDEANIKYRNLGVSAGIVYLLRMRCIVFHSAIYIVHLKKKNDGQSRIVATSKW